MYDIAMTHDMTLTDMYKYPSNTLRAVRWVQYRLKVMYYGKSFN